MLADRFEILDYDNIDTFKAAIAELPELDRTRLLYPITKHSRRAEYIIASNIRTA